MAIGVGTYNDGFGVAFTLLDQFSVVARKIEASMARLTSATSSFSAANSKSLYEGYRAERQTELMLRQNIELAGMAEATAVQQMTASYNVAAAQIAMAEQSEIAAIRVAVAQAETAEAVGAAAARETAINAAMERSNGRRAMEAIEARRLEMVADMEAASAAEAAAARIEAANARAQMSFALLGASVIGLALVVKGAKVDAAFEKAELTIDGFVGSATKAHAVFMQLQADANNNPMMGFQNMLRTTDLLLSQGIGADTSERLTKNLSNLLTSVGRGAPELNRVGRELEKIAANGRITGRELYQAAAAGIPLRNILEDYFGHALPNTLKELPITIADLDGAFQQAMQSGGRYAKAFQKISESVAIAWADLTNNQIPYFFAAIGKAVEPITKVVVEGLTYIVKVLRVFSESWIGKAFWMLTTALLVFGAVISINIIGARAFTWALARMAHGLGHATIAALRTTLANEGLAASFRLLGEAVMANPFFAWFVVIATTVAVASSAITHFKRVMAGTEDVGKGWIGTLQKLGGVLMFVTEAFATYDTMTGKSTVDQKLVTALDKLGLHDLTAKLQTWVGSIVSFMDGFASGMYSFFTTLYDTFEYVTTPIRTVLTMLGILTPALEGSNKAMEGWRRTGKILAWALGTLLVGALTKMGIAAVAAITKIVVAEVALMEFSIPLMAVLWPAMLLIAGSTALIASNMDVMGSSFNSSTKAIDSTAIALQRFNDAQSTAIALQNKRKKIEYDQEHGNTIRGFLEKAAYVMQHGWGQLMGDVDAQGNPTTSSMGAIDMPRVQQQQAQISNSMGGQSYPGLSDVGTKKNDNKDVNVTLNIDGKTLAKILSPYIDEIKRRDSVTSKYA